MSWVSDYFEEQYARTMNKLKAPYELFGAKNGYTDFIDDEVSKAGLRGAEITSFMRGLPIIGNMIGGVEGVQQLEDLYKNSGKVPAYPGSSGPGAQGLAHAGVGVARKIEEGLNDLGAYYSGDVNINDPVNVNGKMTYPTVHRGTSKISKYGGF